MTAGSTFGPFRTEVRRVLRSGRIATCVRIDRLNDEGDWITQALFEAADLWWLIQALQNAHTLSAQIVTDALFEELGRGGASDAPTPSPSRERFGGES